MVSFEVPTFQLMMALSMFTFVVYLAAWIIRPRLEIRWRVPEKAVAGQPVQIACRLVNHSRYWAREVGVGAFDLPPSLRSTKDPPPLRDAAPGKTADVSFGLLPLKRGLYPRPPLRVFSLFPFALFRMEARVIPTKRDSHAPLIVYPNFRPLHTIDVPINARYQPGGIALSSSVGESPEYIGNREYRPGDSTRHLDHRSWARLAAPAIREYQEEYYCRVALVLDTYVPGRAAPGPEGYPELEAAVSLSAAVADALARGEYIVDIFAAGPELYVFRAGRHTAHFQNVLEILACVDACRVNPFGKVTPALAGELANISSVICVFLDWDAERSKLAQAAVEAGCSVKVVIVRDGPTTLPYSAIEGVDRSAQYSPQAIRNGSVDAL